MAQAMAIAQAMAQAMAQAQAVAIAQAMARGDFEMNEVSTFADGEDCKDCESYEKEIKSLRAEIVKLKNDTLFLDALEQAGVDNWGGYGEAQKLYENMK